MASGNLRIHELRNRQGRKSIRKRLVSVSPAEKRALEKQHESISGKGLFEGFNCRNLNMVNLIHGADFVGEIKALSEKFRGVQVQVLDEGHGISIIGVDLRQSLDKDSYKLVTTDMDSTLKPDKVCSPEQLVDVFGREKFHLVISTFAGLNYTKVNRVKAIANVAAVLKPGGKAFIITGVNRDLGTVPISAVEIKRALKAFPDVFVKQEHTFGGERVVLFKK